MATNQMKDSPTMNEMNTFPLINGCHRYFTTTEEADISCFTSPGVATTINEDCTAAVFTHSDGYPEAVVLFALSDNVYIVVQGEARRVWLTTHLSDALSAVVVFLDNGEYDEIGQ